MEQFTKDLKGTVLISLIMLISFLMPIFILPVTSLILISLTIGLKRVIPKLHNTLSHISMILDISILVSAIIYGIISNNYNHIIIFPLMLICLNLLTTSPIKIQDKLVAYGMTRSKSIEFEITIVKDQIRDNSILLALFTVFILVILLIGNDAISAVVLYTIVIYQKVTSYIFANKYDVIQ